MDREPVEREEYAHVPWSELVADARPDRTKLLLAGAALAAAAVIGLFGARLLASASTDPAAATSLATTAIEAPAASDPTSPAPPTPTTESPSVAAPELYAEADLMAVLPDEEMRAVAMRAEWFVRDYFTRDGTGDDDESPLAPPSADRSGSAPSVGAPTTYVEWAKTMRIDPVDPGSYVVTVGYRMLAETTTGAFTRQPVRSVTLPVIVDTNGIPVVADLPAPVALQTAAGPAAPVPEPAPPEITAVALDEAGVFGTDPAVIETSRSATGWRVIVAVTDPTGNRWPLRFEVPAAH